MNKQSSNNTKLTFKSDNFKKLKTDWKLRLDTDKIYEEVVGEVV